jgi:hypothetical protein
MSNLAQAVIHLRSTWLYVVHSLPSIKSRSQCSGQLDTHMHTACSDWSKRVIVGTKEMGVQTGTTHFKIQKEHFMILVGTR